MLKLILLMLLGAVMAAQKPLNILSILTDDQGWGDLDYNCENSTGRCGLTPNLRKLATSPGSAYFHRFYAAAGVCSPTRASVMTGRTNARDCIDFALACCQEDPVCILILLFIISCFEICFLRNFHPIYF